MYINYRIIRNTVSKYLVIGGRIGELYTHKNIIQSLNMFNKSFQ